MGIEDRDWYREETAKRNGHRAVHEWGRKKTATAPTLDDFLKAEREIDKDVYYNPKEFRGSKKCGYSPEKKTQAQSNINASSESAKIQPRKTKKPEQPSKTIKPAESKKYQGVNKREKLVTKPLPRYVKLTTTFYLCALFSVLSIASTFVATLVIALEKPEIFNMLETGLNYLKSLGLSL